MSLSDMTMDNTTMALPEYTPDGWERLRAVADGGITMSFAEYQAKLAGMVRGFEAEGVQITMIAMDVAEIGEMVDWCRREGYGVGPEGRAAFIAHKAIWAQQASDAPVLQ
jgi:hypothetical protein